MNNKQREIESTCLGVLIGTILGCAAVLAIASLIPTELRAQQRTSATAKTFDVWEITTKSNQTYRFAVPTAVQQDNALDIAPILMGYYKANTGSTISRNEIDGIDHVGKFVFVFEQ